MKLAIRAVFLVAVATTPVFTPVGEGALSTAKPAAQPTAVELQVIGENGWSTNVTGESIRARFRSIDGVWSHLAHTVVLTEPAPGTTNHVVYEALIHDFPWLKDESATGWDWPDPEAHWLLDVDSAPMAVPPTGLNRVLNSILNGGSDYSRSHLLPVWQPDGSGSVTRVFECRSALWTSLSATVPTMLNFWKAFEYYRDSNDTDSTDLGPWLFVEQACRDNDGFDDFFGNPLSAYARSLLAPFGLDTTDAAKLAVDAGILSITMQPMTFAIPSWPALFSNDLEVPAPDTPNLPVLRLGYTARMSPVIEYATLTEPPPTSIQPGVVFSMRGTGFIGRVSLVLTLNGGAQITLAGRRIGVNRVDFKIPLGTPAGIATLVELNNALVNKVVSQEPWSAVMIEATLVP